MIAVASPLLRAHKAMIWMDSTQILHIEKYKFLSVSKLVGGFVLRNGSTWSSVIVLERRCNHTNSLLQYPFNHCTIAQMPKRIRPLNRINDKGQPFRMFKIEFRWKKREQIYASQYWMSKLLSSLLFAEDTITIFPMIDWRATKTCSHPKTYETHTHTRHSVVSYIKMWPIISLLRISSAHRFYSSNGI